MTMADSTTGLGVPRERHRAWSLGGALSHTWTPSPRLHLLPVCTWDPRFLALEERLGFGFRHLPYLSRLCPVTCPPCWAFSSNQRSLPHAVPLLSWAQPGLSLRPPPPAFWTRGCSGWPHFWPQHQEAGLPCASFCPLSSFRFPWLGLLPIPKAACTLGLQSSQRSVPAPLFRLARIMFHEVPSRGVTLEPSIFLESRPPAHPAILP